MKPSQKRAAPRAAFAALTLAALTLAAVPLAAVTLAAVTVAGALAPAANAADAGASGTITLSAQDIPVPYTVLGDIRVNVQQMSVFPTVPTRQKLNDALRAEAARMGADAVIFVVYEKGTVLNTKGFDATGKAVKLAPQTLLAARAPAAGDQTPSALASAPSAPTSGAARLAMAAPAGAAASGQAPGAGASASGPAPTPPAHAASASAIILSPDDIPYRRYTILGPVGAVAYQTSLFPKVTPEEELDQKMREQAFSMGADAVVMIHYTAGSPFGKKGSTAEGKAVKFE